MEEENGDMLIKCPACGAANEADSTFCDKCGKRVDGKVLCPACGAANRTGATFCNKCGKQLHKAESNASVKPNRQSSPNDKQLHGTEKIVRSNSVVKCKTKVCPVCDKANSDTATFCLRCGKSLADIPVTNSSSSLPNTSSSVGQAHFIVSRSVRPVIEYDTPRHVLSLLLAAVVLVFVFLIRMNGVFLYDIFDTVKALPDEAAVRAPVILGAAVYIFTVAAVCALFVFAAVNDIMCFADKYVPAWLDKAWAANAFLVYAGGITVLQTVLNGSNVINSLDGSNIAGLLLGGALAVLYTFVYLQNSSSLSFNEQLLRMISMCLSVVLWILVGLPQFSLKTETETLSVGEGYMPLLLASFILDSKVSVNAFIAGQLFQMLFVFAVCGMLWICLFEEESRLRNFAQSVAMVLFALFHLIVALVVRETYLDLIKPKNPAGYYPGISSGAVSDNTATGVYLHAIIPVVIFLLSLGQVVVACISQRIFSPPSRRVKPSKKEKSRSISEQDMYAWANHGLLK